MSQNNDRKCPDTTTLADYLLGQLEPPTLDECESHIADCDNCHETLRGLSAEDTLSEHVAGAFLQSTESDSFTVDSAEDVHVRGLVDRLLTQTNNRSLGPKPSAADTEILADRAAEVLRCVEPDPNNKTLGSIGNYQLIRLIGAGSTGVVFQAIDQKLDRTVALKVLRPSLGSVARERFIAEARLAASIEHPNVVTIYQIDQYDRLAFIAMQWLPGQTLEAKLQSTATMADEDVRRIAAQVAAGLQAAHQRQLVHRDIKPANVWISDDDGVKILDFGLARIVDDDPGLTATGMLAGTPNFMSPEQTKGHELDGRSDLFSLGCMMYRMATGKFAFGATSILGTLQAIQHEHPTPPKFVNADISNDLSDLTMSLLEKQPANRPESAAQVVTMLEAERGQWPMKIAGYESPQPASQNELKSQAKRHGFGGRWVAFIAASLLGLVGWYLSPQIIRIASDQGELVIESEGKDVEVEILQDGKVVRVLDMKTKNSFNIDSGEYQIKAAGEGNSFEVTPNSLTMKRGQKTIVSVTKQQGASESIAKKINRDVLDLQTADPKMKADGSVVDRPFLKTYPVTVDPKLANDVLETMLEGRDVRMQQDEMSGAITVLGRKEDHRLIVESLASISNIKTTNFAIIELRNIRARDASRLLQEIGPSGAVVSANRVLNQIIVSGTALEIAQVRKIAEEIDIPESDKSPDLLDPLLLEENSQLQSQLIKSAEQRKQVQARREQATLNRATYKGKPFAHWINIVETERSAEMLTDALKAGAELAESKEEKSELLEVARTLARKFGSPTFGEDNKLDQYHEALLTTMLTFEPKEVVQFVLTELEQGTQASIGFCAFLVNRDLYGLNTAPERARSDSLLQTFAERGPEILRRLVARLERGETRSELVLLNSLEQTLTGMLSQWGGMGGGAIAGGPGNSFEADFDQAHVDRVKELNKELAPTIRQLFLDSSASTKSTLTRLTRAFWQNDEQVELALQTAVLDPSAQLNSQWKRQWMYQLITGEDGHGGAGPRRDVLRSSPEPLALLFLKKLLDNQLGPNSQRIKFLEFEKVESSRLLGFAQSETAVVRRIFVSNQEDAKTIEGRPTMVYQILNSLGNIVLLPNHSPNEKLDVETIKPILEKILAVENSEDAELKADIEAMKTLLVFKNAKTLLDHITNQPTDSPSPKSTSPKVANKATYKGKPFAHWINIFETERSAEMLTDALKAGAELVETEEEKTQLLEVVRTLARKHETDRPTRNRPEEDVRRQYSIAIIDVMKKFEPKEVVQFMLTELEHGTSKSVNLCGFLVPSSAGLANKESLCSAAVEQAPELLRRIVLRLEREGEPLDNSDRKFLEELERLLFSNGRRNSKYNLDPAVVAQVKERNKDIAPTIRELFLKSSASTRDNFVELTRAYWPNDEQVELALQATVFDPSTQPDLRNRFYRWITWEYSRAMDRRTEVRANENALLRSPESLSLLFLQKLLDNQLGSNSQRIRFGQGEKVDLKENKDYPRYYPRYFSRDSKWLSSITRRSNRDKEPTIEGRAVMVCEILNSLMNIATEPIPNERGRVRLREGGASEALANEKIKPLLEKILAVETSEDAELRADIESMKTLQIFKNARTLLDHITNQPTDSPSPELTSSDETSKATYKGKPFVHWINIVETERSTEILTDALKAGYKLAETTEEKAMLLKVVRTLARKSSSSSLSAALRIGIRTQEPKEIVQFVLTELEEGTPDSIDFCSSLLERYFYVADSKSARNNSHSSALAKQAPELLRQTVIRIDRGETRSASLLAKLTTSLSQSKKDKYRIDLALIAQLKKQNKELAPTIRALFLNGSAYTKTQLIQLTRAYWPNDEQVELALHAEVFDTSTQPHVRDGLYEWITTRDRTNQLPSSDALTLLFLKKLMDNQLGPDSQRIKFVKVEVFATSRRSRGRSARNIPNDFSADLTGKSINMKELAEPINGRPAVVYRILCSAMNITTKWVQPSSNGISRILRKKRTEDLKEIKSLLEQILAIETTEDPELKADLESMRSLLIFKSAKALLEEIGKLKDKKTD